MSRFKQAITGVIFLLLSLPAIAQEPIQQDTLLITDSIHEDTEQDFDEDTDFNQSTLHNRPLSQIPDTIAFREVSDSIAARLRKQKAFEYANDPAYWIRKAPETKSVSFSFWKKVAEFFNRPAVRAVFYLLLAGLVIFLVVKIILVNNLYIFKSSNKKVKRVTDGGDAALMEEDLDQLISDAMQKKDHRAVIRYHYLKTLKLLDRKGWISFNPQATNWSYRSQVNNFSKGKEFGFLSSAYEYVWYGDFRLNEQQFETLVHNFNHFQNMLRV